MFLSPRDIDKLYIFISAEVARKRKTRGLKLNYSESIALIADHILEVYYNKCRDKYLVNYYEHRHYLK